MWLGDVEGLNGFEADDGLAVCAVGRLFTEGRGAVRDDACGAPFEEFPVHFQRAAGGDAVLEFADEGREAELLEGGDVASVWLWLSV